MEDAEDEVKSTRRLGRLRGKRIDREKNNVKENERTECEVIPGRKKG